MGGWQTVIFHQHMLMQMSLMVGRLLNVNTPVLSLTGKMVSMVNICVDRREPNKVVVPGNHSLPLIEDCQNYC